MEVDFYETKKLINEQHPLTKVTRGRESYLRKCNPSLSTKITQQISDMMKTMSAMCIFATVFVGQTISQNQRLNSQSASLNQRNQFQRQIIDEAQELSKPYDFGYNIQDEFGNNQFRQESSNNQGVVKGSYGYTDAFGLYRRVEYVADENGFRAEVKSNEPGVKDDQPANAHFTVEEVPKQILRSISSVSPSGESAALRSSIPRVRFEPTKLTSH